MFDYIPQCTQLDRASEDFTCNVVDAKIPTVLYISKSRYTGYCITI
jgi:hypothetical protein